MKLINLINQQAQRFLNELTTKNGKTNIYKARTDKNKSNKKNGRNF